MSDRAAPRDLQFDHIGELFQQLFDWAILDLNFCVPGIVKQYNARTRRATVQPGNRRVFADGEERAFPPIHNVQVVWPRGRHGSLHFRLQDGDPVLLLFSQSGLAEFRRTHRLSTPDANGGHALKDAMAIPGFGAVQEIEAVDDYDTWQSDDGQRSFRMNESTVEAHNADTNFVLRPDGVEVNADGDLDMTAQGDIGLTATGAVNMNAGGAVAITSSGLFHNGVNVGATHRHGGVLAGGATTGTPQ